MLIREIMNQYPATCRTGTPVAEAARMMQQKDFGFLPVLDDAGRVAGALTDRDIVCRVVATGRDPASTIVAQCMSQPPITLDGDADLATCMEAMRRHQVKRILVAERGICMGVVSLADLAGNAPRAEMGALVEGLVQAERPLAVGPVSSG